MLPLPFGIPRSTQWSSSEKKIAIPWVYLMWLSSVSYLLELIASVSRQEVSFNESDECLKLQTMHICLTVMSFQFLPTLVFLLSFNFYFGKKEIVSPFKVSSSSKGSPFVTFMFPSLILFQNYSLYSANFVLGQFWTFSNLDVLFTATLGESCANPARNCMGNTECSGSGFCVCTSDYVPFGSTCVYAFGWWMTFLTFLFSYVVSFLSSLCLYLRKWIEWQSLSFSPKET